MDRPPPLSELKRLYVDEGHPLSADLEARLRADPRAGARAILTAIDKRRRAHRAEGQRLRRLLAFEREFWGAGLLLVAGVDEAGMAPLAGPVVAAAVVLAPDTRIAGVDDSKKLDARTRERLALVIKERARAWGVGLATVEEIDRVNIHHAGLLAMRRAVDALGVTPAALLIDARTLRSACCPQRALIHGDARSLSIAAASIIAKTTRDALMDELDARHPGYGFAKHKGYGVPEHLAALGRLGVSPVHRRSFAPVRAAMGLAPLATTPADPGAAHDAGDDEGRWGQSSRIDQTA